MKDIWEKNLYQEIGYWQQMIDGSFHKKDWVDGFRRRVVGIDICPVHLHKYLQGGGKILDVGAGPVTVLGKVLQGTELNITAIDPLAKEYQQLFESNNIKPAVETVYGEAENLLAYFLPASFSFVYSRNALDHSYNPLNSIQKMIRVCCPGGFVVIENVINAGLNENYKGLHQWNFMPVDNDLVIWTSNGYGKLLSHYIDGYTSLSVSVHNEKWVIVEIEV